MKEKIGAVFAELKSFSYQEKIFIYAAMFAGFLICGEYSIIRSVANSLFVTHFGSQYIPYAWVAVIPLNLLIVSLYNRYLPRLGCLKMFFVISAVVVLSNVTGSFYLKKIPALSFVFYLWKEVYILLMLQQLWSVVHSTIQQSRVKYLYGLLFATGGLGGILFSSVPRFFAVKAGSENLLLLTLPLYIILGFVFTVLIKNSHSTVQQNKQEDAVSYSFKDSIRLISRSQTLLFIFLAVVFMHFFTAFVDFEFNSFLEKTIPGKDLRTQYYGKIFTYINMITLAMQLFGTFFIVRLLGLRKSHFFVPIVLGVNALCFAFFPVFAVISCAFTGTKALEFSFFGVIKEMLYSPLKREEKFHAKSVIDVFIHRTAKSVAALLIIFFQLFFTLKIFTLINVFTALILIFWVVAVHKLCFEPKPEIA